MRHNEVTQPSHRTDQRRDRHHHICRARKPTSVSAEIHHDVSSSDQSCQISAFTHLWPCHRIWTGFLRQGYRLSELGRVSKTIDERMHYIDADAGSCYTVVETSQGWCLGGNLQPQTPAVLRTRPPSRCGGCSVFAVLQIRFKRILIVNKIHEFFHILV